MPNMKIKQEMTISSKPSRLFTKAALIVAMLTTAQISIANEQKNSINDDLNYAVGLQLGGFGLGASLSFKTNWTLISGDQIQWRTSLSSMGIETNSEINNIDYGDADTSIFALKTGVDWYPYQRGWAEEVFISAGMLYVDSDFHGVANTNKPFNIDGVTVNSGDINSLETDIQQSGVSPYLSLGWGNKLTGKRGFDFQAEIGLSYQVSDNKVRVTADDPNNFLTASNLRAEEVEIRGDINDIKGFASFTVSYLF